MRSPRLLSLLLVALLVPLALVGALGLRAMAGDVDRARSLYAEQAGTFARSVVDMLAAEAGELERNAECLAWRASAEAELLEPGVPARRGTFDGGERSLREFASAEIDALEREARVEEALARLRELAAQASRPALAAWAEAGLAARAHQAGRVEEARDAWQRVVERFPDARDDRGLPRALAARSELLRLEGDPPAELERLHGDVLADRTSLSDTAAAALALDLVARATAKDPERAARMRAALELHARPLRLQAAWSQGISEWIARGAVGGTGVFALPVDPLLEALHSGRVLIVARPQDPTAPGSEAQGATHGGATSAAASAWSGWALELERLAARALERADDRGWRELGFRAALEDGAGRVLAGEAPAGDAPTAVERARAPLGELLVRAHGTGFDTFVTEERRRFRLVAGLSMAALLAAAGAGFAAVRALEREMRAAREREQFVAAVTHELKSPLASIRLLAELLEQGEVAPEKVREFGGRTVRESDRLARLVDSVLRFARLEQGLRGADVETLELRALMDAAVGSVAPLARERGFEVRTGEVPDLRLRGDRDALVGALAELIDNATKYGAPAAGVELEVERRGPRVRVRVLDRGAGVPAGERERIFEPFVRLGDELTRERPGVGLGLALVRATARAHGGEAGLDAREGGGSVAWIEVAAESETSP